MRRMKRFFTLVMAVVVGISVIGYTSEMSAKTKRTARKATTSKRQHTPVQISEPDGYIDGHGYVDLGLPSGTKWAIYNVGAEAPTEYGYYFSWGNIKPYQYPEKAVSRMNGVRIENICGDAQYDAATANFGKNWQMPAIADVTELEENCELKEVKINGTKGLLIIGKNKKNIFMPYAGEYFADSNEFGEDSLGFWTGESEEVPYSDSNEVSWCIENSPADAEHDDIWLTGSNVFRNYALSIRAVSK